MSTDLVGKTLGSYRIEELIGVGGMGRVYRAVHQRLQAQRAIKVLHENYSANPNICASFLREAQTLASLRHNNILAVHDCGEQEGLLYIVMELVNGGSLSQLLSHPENAQQPWSLSLGVELIKQAAMGLAAAHAKGVLHRDIKPENLLLQADGTYTLKIADFGLARLIEVGTGTETGTVKGTPAYMSPEQCQGLQLDARSDLYSLGAVLYEVATGKTVFESPSLSAAVYKHVNEAPRSPREIRTELPEKLEQIILRCLAKKPADRYHSASELAAELQMVASDLDYTVVNLPGPRPVPPPLPAELLNTTALDAPRLTVMKSDGQDIQTINLPRGALTIGRAGDNDLKLDSQDVSNHHARLEWDGDKAKITDLGSRNGIFLEGNQLVPQIAHDWDGRHPIAIGPFWLRLSLPEKPVSIQHESSGISSLPAGRIGVRVDRKELTLTPGRPAVCRLTLENMGRIVDHIGIEIEGAPSQWVQWEGREIQLNPGEQQIVTLTITVPEESSSSSGGHKVKIIARSKEDPRVISAVEVAWEVLPFARFNLSITPRKASTRCCANYKVTVDNEGNDADSYELSFEDSEAKLTGKFLDESQNYQPRLIKLVNAGEKAEVMLNVMAPRKWLGASHLYDLNIQAKPLKRRDEKSLSAQHHQKPVLPYWLVALVILFMMVTPVSLGLDSTRTIYRVNTNLNVRSEPSKDSNKVDTISRNSRGIVIVERSIVDASWVRIKYKNIEGWVDRSYLALDRRPSTLSILLIIMLFMLIVVALFYVLTSNRGCAKNVRIAEAINSPRAVIDRQRRRQV